MEQLQCRFESNKIYTFIGDILLAINPFTSLGLYSTLVSFSNEYLFFISSQYIIHVRSHGQCFFPGTKAVY